MNSNPITCEAWTTSNMNNIKWNNRYETINNQEWRSKRKSKTRDDKWETWIAMNKEISIIKLVRLKW